MVILYVAKVAQNPGGYSQKNWVWVCGVKRGRGRESADGSRRA